MRRTAHLMSIGLVFALAMVTTVPVNAASEPVPCTDGTQLSSVPVTKFAGSDRYATAVAIARAAFPSGSTSVVLTAGSNWPDAVGGGSLAGATDGPVLLTPMNRIPAEVLACIRDLAPDHVYVLGGEQAISEHALSSLSSVGVDEAEIERLAGMDRFETAAIVASVTVDSAPGWSGHAYVSTGWDFADALASGPLRAATSDPIFLISDDRAESIVASIATRGVTDVTILGGTAAVSTSVESMLDEALGATHVDRIAGHDRYQTATNIAEYAVARAGFSYARCGVATGEDFADAITGGVLLGRRLSPLLLTPRTEVHDRTAQWLYARRDVVAGYNLFGGDGAISGAARADLQFALIAPPFSQANAMEHVNYLAALGARAAGGTAERRAFDYIAACLRSWGYSVTVQNVPLLDGSTSHNVIAEHAGSEAGVIVLGAHVDSKAPSPGANDNASGVAVVLELARVLASASTVPTVRFIAFGAEEIGGPTPSDHHFGSRRYVANLTSSERARIQGMVSVDMVGYGSTFNVRSLREAPQTVVSSLQSCGSALGQSLPFLLDPSSTGWSDHEAFEFAGIPAAWLEWRDDPVYHTIYDTASHVQPSRVRASGRLLRAWVLRTTPESLGAFR